MVIWLLIKIDELLTPFRTWRNTRLTSRGTIESIISFQYSATLEHCASLPGNSQPGISCKKISYLTTLAGYIHWKLTGVKVLGMVTRGMFSDR
jgi:hypothetical protein